MQLFAAERTLGTRNKRGMHRVVVCLLDNKENRRVGWVFGGDWVGREILSWVV